MDAAYLKAAHPRPFRIFGKKLMPFSLGHELLFQKFGNKFSIESKEDPSIHDLMTGVFLCSRPYSPDVSLEDFKIPFAARFWGWILGRAYINRAYSAFAEYIAEHTEIPEFYAKDSPKQNTGTPTIHAVKISLEEHLHRPTMEAWNTSFSLAFWDHLAWLESQGAIQIVDEADRKRQAHAKAMAEKVDAFARKVLGC